MGLFEKKTIFGLLFHPGLKIENKGAL